MPNIIINKTISHRFIGNKRLPTANPMIDKWLAGCVLLCLCVSVAKNRGDYYTYVPYTLLEPYQLTAVEWVRCITTRNIVER